MVGHLVDQFDLRRRLASAVHLCEQEL
eukprot:COSAG01_NODE_65750_length_272_cov_0.872832_1_plen_26_part_01